MYTGMLVKLDGVPTLSSSEERKIQFVYSLQNWARPVRQVADPPWSRKQNQQSRSGLNTEPDRPRRKPQEEQERPQCKCIPVPWCPQVYKSIFCLFVLDFLPNLGIPPTSQLKAKANICFLKSMWSQPTTSFRRAACALSGSGITDSEESAIHSIPCAWGLVLCWLWQG